MAYHQLKAPPGSGQAGWVYTLHFNAPFGHAGHYTGWASNLAARLSHHQNGKGSNLCRRARDAGITWVLASVTEGDKNEERRLEDRGGASRRCPVCKGGQPEIDPRAAALLSSLGGLRA